VTVDQFISTDVESICIDKISCFLAKMYLLMLFETVFIRC